MTDRPYSTRLEIKRATTTDNGNRFVGRDLGLVEEVRMLKQHMKNMYEAWMTGQPLPPPPLGFSDILPPMVVSHQATLTKTEDSLNRDTVLKPSDSLHSNSVLTVEASGPYGHSSHFESFTEIEGTKDVESGNTTWEMKESLVNIKKRCDENFREFASRWREQAAKVRPQMKEDDIVKAFLRVQEGGYYPYLLSALGKDFDEVIKMGEMVEEGIKSGRLVSFATLKATTQAIQNGLGNFGSKKKKEDVTVVTQGSRQESRRPPRHYSHNYTQDPSQHYYPQNDRVSYDPYPRQDYGRNQRSRDIFTPIGESYSVLYRKLRNLNMIGVLSKNNADPNSKGFNPTARCAYHSDAPGHSTEECRSLRREVERMIKAKMIVVQNDDPPNVTENPLPAHHDVNCVEVIYCGKRHDSSSNFQEKTAKVVGASAKAHVQISG